MKIKFHDFSRFSMTAGTLGRKLGRFRGRGRKLGRGDILLATLIQGERKEVGSRAHFVGNTDSGGGSWGEGTFSSYASLG